jgi:hypothetical protein
MRKLRRLIGPQPRTGGYLSLLRPLQTLTSITDTPGDESASASRFAERTLPARTDDRHAEEYDARQVPGPARHVAWRRVRRGKYRLWIGYMLTVDALDIRNVLNRLTLREGGT